MSEQDILDETGGVGGSAYQRLAKLKSLMADRAVEAKQRQLAIARAAYESAIKEYEVDCQKIDPPPIDEVRADVRELFTNRGEIPLAIAWRNGEYQSDSDLISLWCQLRKLGVIASSKK